MILHDKYMNQRQLDDKKSSIVFNKADNFYGSPYSGINITLKTKCRTEVDTCYSLELSVIKIVRFIIRCMESREKESVI